MYLLKIAMQSRYCCGLLFAGGPKMSMVRMWGASSRGGAGNDQSNDGSTVVSRQTVDSWGGLAPPHRSLPYAPSETVGGD